MRFLTSLLCLMLLTGLALVGCDKSIDPTPDINPDLNAGPDLNNLLAASWPHANYFTPGPLVTAAVGEKTVEFWPYTGADLSGAPKDPINLVFFGEADPRDIRAALLSLDGDRTAFGMDALPPFNSTWDDAMGDIQASFGTECCWPPSAIQLACGDYQQARVHLRLFKVGKWTLGGAHFEVLIPGTTDHQVLSWEVAEQFVTVDFMRSGLLDEALPMLSTGPINDAPFRTIPSVIYNGLPVELRGLIGGPLGDVTDDVPIGTDGQATVFNLAGKVDRVAETRTQDILINFDQVIPKPFCASGPYDYVYVAGPVTLTNVAELKPDGNYQASFYAEGELIVQPVNPITGEPIGDPLTARVKEIHNSVFTEGLNSASSLRFQSLRPVNAPGAGWFFERFRVSSRGGSGYQIIVECESDQVVSADLIARTPSTGDQTASAAKRLMNIR